MAIKNVHKLVIKRYQKKNNRGKTTEIFVNDEGSVTISQEGHVCPSCGVAEDAIVVFGTASRLRTIANELMRLAAELERGRQ